MPHGAGGKEPQGTGQMKDFPRDQEQGSVGRAGIGHIKFVGR